MKIYNEEYAKIIEEIVEKLLRGEGLKKEKPLTDKDLEDEDACETLGE